MLHFTAAEGRTVRTTLDRVTEGVTERVTESEKLLLELLLEDPTFTYIALAERLGISRKSVSARIKSLKEKEVIRRVGSDTKGYWEIIL